MFINADEFKMYVYFLLDPKTGHVKIGQTKDPQTRIAALNYEYGGGLVLVGLIEDRMPLETILHQMFAHLNVEGEWFKVAPELSAAITELNMGTLQVGGHKAAPKKKRISDLLDILRERPNATLREIASELGISHTSVKRYIDKLMEQGKVRDANGSGYEVLV